MKNLLYVITALLALALGTPLINEEAPGQCVALERRFSNVMATTSPAFAKNPIGAALFIGMAGEMLTGDIASSIIKIQSPNIPSVFSCNFLYWRSVFDISVLSFPKKYTAPTPPINLDDQGVRSPLPAHMPEPFSPAPPKPPSNVVPDSRELNNTLERLRSLQRQTQAPTARATPSQSSTGGSPNGTQTDRLSVDQRGAIGDKVRECWTKDAGALDLEKMQALLLVTVDAAGTARMVEIAPEDEARMGDPRFRAFVERARRAALNPRCANLPLPAPMISGGRGTIKFRFAPHP